MPQGPTAAVEGCSAAGASSIGGSQHCVWHQHQRRSLYKWWGVHCPVWPTWWPSCIHSPGARGLEHATHGMQHASFQRALLRMPRHCTPRDLRTVRQRVMPYFPQVTIVKSTTGRNRAAAHVPLQSIVHNAISMARVIGKPPRSGVAIVVISVHATSLWKVSSTRADVWVNVWGGGAKYASKVKLWASWFCMDGGDEQAFLRSLDISANLNQGVRDVEEDVSYGYSNPMGYQTSDFRLLWTIPPNPQHPSPPR